MSSSKSARCLFCRLRPVLKAPSTRTSGQQLHTTGSRNKAAKASQGNYTKYSPRQRQLLALKYTPEQLKVIEAGEKSIDVEDIKAQGRFRGDQSAIRYYDDLSKIKHIVDKPVRAPDEDVDVNIRLRTDDEVKRRFGRHMDTLAQHGEFHAEQVKSYANPQDRQRALEQAATQLGVYPGDGLAPEERAARLKTLAEFAQGPDEAAHFERFVSDANNFMHSPKGTLDSQASALAPELPLFHDTRLVDASIEGLEMDYLIKQTGLPLEVIKKLRVKVLVVNRVANMTRLGKVYSMYYLTCVGDGNGMLGIGEGKSEQGADGTRQAMMSAVRSMKPVPRHENRTIYGEVEAKVGASVVRLSSRPPGKHFPVVQNPHPCDVRLTCGVSRLRQPRSTAHLRNGSRRRYCGHLGKMPTLTQQDECMQGGVRGIVQSTSSRRYCEGER